MKRKKIKKLFGIWMLAFTVAVSLIPVSRVNAEIIEWPAGPYTNAKTAVLIEAESGTVLYDKDMKEKMFPASTTKIITALLAIENLDLDTEITMTHDAVYSMGWDASRVGMEEGEVLTLMQSLYAILLASANEVSYAVAERVGNGDIDVFLEMANERADELGCVNTNITNPHGLHDENHYTCAYDLALIMKKCIEYDTFCDISNNYYYKLPNNPAGEERVIAQTHKILRHTLTYDGVFAGKTGSTNEAGYCLVTAAKRDGMTLIAVVMGEGTNSDSYTDTMALFDYGFDNFKTITMEKAEKSANDFPELFDTGESVSLGLEIPVSVEKTVLVVPQDATESDITVQSSVTKLLVLEQGENKIGEITYLYGDRVLGNAEINLYSAEYTIVDPAELYLQEVGGTEEFDEVQYERLKGTYEWPVEEKKDYTKPIVLYSVGICVTLVSFLFLLWIFVKSRK